MKQKLRSRPTSGRSTRQEQEEIQAGDSELDAEALSCCLDLIDAVLEDEEAKLDEAKREFAGVITKAEIEAFNARWSWMGLRAYRDCCGCGCSTMLDNKDGLYVDGHA